MQDLLKQILDLPPIRSTWELPPEFVDAFFGGVYCVRVPNLTLGVLREHEPGSKYAATLYAVTLKGEKVGLFYLSGKWGSTTKWIPISAEATRRLAAHLISHIPDTYATFAGDPSILPALHTWALGGDRRP